MKVKKALCLFCDGKVVVAILNINSGQLPHRARAVETKSYIRYGVILDWKLLAKIIQRS